MGGDRRESHAGRGRTAPDRRSVIGLAGLRVASERGGGLGLRPRLLLPAGAGRGPADRPGSPGCRSASVPGAPHRGRVVPRGGDPLPVDPPSLSRARRNAGHVVARQTLGDRHSGHEPGQRRGATSAAAAPTESADRDRLARLRRLSELQPPQQDRRPCADRRRGPSRLRATCSGEHARARSARRSRSVPTSPNSTCRRPPTASWSCSTTAT